MEDRIVIFQTNQEFEANVLKMKLDNAGIPAWIMNKHDSSYNNFGDVEIVVLAKDAEKAKEVLGSEA